MKKTTKKVLSKTLKKDENNQYGQAMAKPLPYGCVKKKDRVATLTEFNKILDSISHDDKIGHLFTVSIKFDKIYEKTLLFNETYPPILKKNKKIDRFERSTLQLMSAMIRDEKKKKQFSFSLKNTFNTERKKIISLYAEDLHFLITGAGWLVTYIYAHYTFE